MTASSVAQAVSPESLTDTPDLFVIPKPLVEALLAYLGGRPYAEVAAGVQLLQQLQPLKPPASSSVDSSAA